jgi:serine/threonine protein phosphatase 1
LNILVVGDVHGCLYTFQSLLDRHWTSDDILIQVGDIIDRGNFSAETIQYLQKLQESFPERVIILRGNHEQEFIEYAKMGINHRWLRQRGSKTLESFARVKLSVVRTASWMKNLPLSWESDRIFVSHAGISRGSKNPFDPNDSDSVVWTRQPLKNLGKVQIVGHTPTKSGMPEYNPRSNSWYIDTGASFSRYLSAIKLTSKGKAIDTYSIKTLTKDL